VSGDKELLLAFDGGWGKEVDVEMAPMRKRAASDSGGGERGTSVRRG
jgi:hypothetical protein